MNAYAGVDLDATNNYTGVIYEHDRGHDISRSGSAPQGPAAQEPPFVKHRTAPILSLQAMRSRGR